MKHVAAYLLASLGGNASPTRDDVRAILASVGADADDGKMELLFKAVEGKDAAELVATGREMLAFAAPCGAAANGGAAAPAAGDAAKEEEEKVEEKVEEEEDDNIFSLFDD